MGFYMSSNIRYIIIMQFTNKWNFKYFKIYFVNMPAVGFFQGKSKKI